ncbi:MULTISPECIES: winged helix-turn-helix domain-containing protein [Gammaproteobacteria]|uniref:winged helix-turn-helix domain-containing protein n=1 Tax=Gammaproteobacteria TaxID=1236 RepID=UPI0015F66F8E|nr:MULTISPECIES: transcriptional regulator [Gammaproteobacteria]MDA8488740.1 transcriptional regulator [Kluyvera sp. Awk 3]
MNKRYCSVNNWLVDVTSGSILHLTTGERKRLGEYQLKLLDILVQDAGKIFTREELTNLVWERRVIGNNSLPNAIHALRTALEDDGKNQRIIKTIPRKGYLLEAEYCCVVEKDEDEVSDPEEDRDVQEDYLLSPQPETDAITEVAEKAADIQPVAEAAVAAAPKQRRSGMLAFMLVILLTATATAGVCWYLFGGRAEHLVAREVQPGVYSNIRLYTVEAMGDPAYMSANLYGKLKDSLYALNQQIKMQSATMNVYFHTNNSSLNYSFMLSNQCDKKQLAMAIYHWRTDTVQLNNVILRETRRKLNELATCKAN